MESFLTGQQVKGYKKMHKQQKEKRNADRIKAILLLNAGYDYLETAEILLMDEDSIRRWHNAYKTGGTEHLLQLQDRCQGGKPKLSMEALKEVSDYLQEHVCLSAKEVCHHVKEHYGIDYTVKGMTALLHRLGFVYKKPKHLPGKANREAQQEFIRHYNELKATKQAVDKIWHMDGVHPLHNSLLGYGWFKKGKEKFVKTNTGRQRVNINGAYNAEEEKIVVREDERINAQSTLALIEQIRQQQPQGKIYLIADNARYYRCRLVNEYLQQHERIQIIFLPPYSPNLNLIERPWLFFRKKRLWHQYDEKYEEFKSSCMEFFENIHLYKTELQTLMTDNFQLLHAA